MWDNSRVRPLVTIAIPTYNRLNSYLPKTVESARKQTYENVEIVISDNGSGDNTEAYVADLNDYRIRYFQQDKNIGITNNVNFCLKQAKGQFVVVLLDDDLLDLDFVETCLRAIGPNLNIGAAITGVRIIDGDDIVLSESYNRGVGVSLADFFLSWFENRIPLYLCNTLFNTEHLRTVGGFRSKHNCYDDAVAQAQIISTFGRIDIYEAKACFRRHFDNSGLRVSMKEWCEDSLYLLDVICNQVDRESCDMIYKRGMKALCQQNYDRSKRIVNKWKRITGYFRVYRSFNFCLSPFGYLWAEGKKCIKSVIQVSIKKKCRF